MLAIYFDVAASTELKINLKVAGVLLTARPVEFHIHRGSPMVERPRLLDRIVIDKFVAVQLKTVAGEMDVSLT